MVDRKNDANRKVGDVMIRDVVTVDSGTTLFEAAKKMRDANIGMLPVTEGGVVRGIVTDRDLVIRAMAKDVRPSEVRVSEYVSEPPRCAETEWTLEEAMDEMARQHVGRLPVVDSGGVVCGVVTLSSLALRSAKRDETLDTAQEVARRSTRSA
jgi:CBS domain-containing protein